MHPFVNGLERPIGTYLYGRRMYETMVFWETVSTGADQSTVMREFAEIWRAAEKIVYSRTLQTVSCARTRIERDFDIDAIRRLKEALGPDITIGGAELAGQAIRAGLVDECHLFLTPILVRAACGRSPAKQACRLGSGVSAGIWMTLRSDPDCAARGRRPLRHAA